MRNLGLAGSMVEELAGTEGSHGLGDLQNDIFDIDSLTFGICGVYLKLKRSKDILFY